MREFFEPPDVQCPRCSREAFRWTDGSSDSRLALLASRLLLRWARRLLNLRTWCDRCGLYFRAPHALPRTVVGYHGCDRTFAADLVTGRKSNRDWRLSHREFEWLGEGVYFWEHAPGRAWQWAEEHHPGKEAVVAVEIRLGRCMDLADIDFAPLLLSSTSAIFPRAIATTAVRASSYNAEVAHGTIGGSLIARPCAPTGCESLLKKGRSRTECLQ